MSFDDNIPINSPFLIHQGNVKRSVSGVDNSYIAVEFSSTNSPSYSSHLYDNVSIYSDTKGVFIGAIPPKETKILLMYETGNTPHPLKYYSSDTSILPKSLKEGELLLKNNHNNILYFKENNVTVLGDSNNRGLLLDNANSIININYNNHFSFSQSGTSFSGIIKREIVPSENQGDRLIDDKIYYTSQTVGFYNPSFSSQKLSKLKSVSKNFVEDRNVIYEFEFQPSEEVLDMEGELKVLSSEKISPSINGYEDRNKSKLNCLNLGLTAPNFLIESIKGTVVDIYGNLLDLNRYPIKTNLDSQVNDNLKKSYLKLKEDQRRSIAFHFELNAKKDLGETGKSPDVNNTENYARSRSRFFVDIDKEGQFKINVPASSETGNIPLLTRYENFNTVKSSKDPSTLHPNKLNYFSTNEEKIDVLHDSFATGMNDSNSEFESSKSKLGSYNKGLITIKKDGAEISPVDRISKDVSSPTHIKHGTAHHDILATCVTHQNKDYTDYLYDKANTSKSKWWADTFPTVIIDPSKNQFIASKEIEIGKNAGGRSGSINLDGSIELNIGANTIDRQSIWLDTAGGMIANFGRDKNNISAAISMDGQLLIQLGGKGVARDDRFKLDKNFDNSFTPGCLDIRVIGEGGFAAVLRIDSRGIVLMSPTGIHLQSNGDLTLESRGGDVVLEGENVVINQKVHDKPVTTTADAVVPEIS